MGNMHISLGLVSRIHTQAQSRACCTGKDSGFRVNEAAAGGGTYPARVPTPTTAAAPSMRSAKGNARK